MTWPFVGDLRLPLTQAQNGTGAKRGQATHAQRTGKINDFDGGQG
jgi:hypothetical protein